MEYMAKRKRKPTYLILLLLIIFVVLIVVAFVKVNTWYDKHYFELQSPLYTDLRQPIKVEERVPEVKEVVLDYPDEIDTPLEVYICEKFGMMDCKTALAIFKSESGLREDAFNINSNNTIDVGIAQINSLHFGKEGCSLQEIVYANNNVDCAYSIWQEQGWTPWVQFNNGNYLEEM